MRTRAESRIENIDLMKEVLLDLFPGRDVRITFRTRKHRELAGYWVWSLPLLSHEQVSVWKMRDSRSEKELIEYRSSIIYRTLRWKDILRKYTEITDREHR